MIPVTYLVGWPTVCIVRVKNTNPECWWLLALLPVHIKTKPGYNSRWFIRIMLVTSSQNQTGATYCPFRTDHVLTTERWKPRRVVINTGLSENIHESLIKRCLKIAKPKEICKYHVAASMHHDTWGLMQSHFYWPYWRPDSSYHNEPALGGYR